MKEESFIQSLTKWIRIMRITMTPDDWAEGIDSEDDESHLTKMELGMSLIEIVRGSIESDKSRIWRQNPILIEAMSACVKRDISPRLESLIEHGLIPPRELPRQETSRPEEEAASDAGNSQAGSSYQIA